MWVEWMQCMLGVGWWIVKAMMSRPEYDLRVVVEDGQLLIDVVESTSETPQDDGDLPTVKALVEGTAPSSVANTEFPPPDVPSW